MKKREMEKDWRLLHSNWTTFTKKFDSYTLFNCFGILLYLLINSLKRTSPYCRSPKIVFNLITIHTSSISSTSKPTVAFRIVYIYALIIVLCDSSMFSGLGIELGKMRKWRNRKRNRWLYVSSKKRESE